MAYGYYTDPGTSFGTTGQTQPETFIERQRRLQQASQPAGTTTTTQTATPANGGITSPAPTGGTPSTPVSGSGKIPEPAPVAAPAPQAAPAPAPAPAAPQPPTPPSPKPAPLPDGREFVPTQDGSGWVTPDHPLAWKAPAGAPAAPTAPSGPAGPSAGSALGGPAEAAKSGMFTQFAAPEHDFQNWQQLEMVSNLLANPHTMGANVLEQMKQRSMEEALLFQQQAEQQQAEELAARGFSAPGGLAAAQKRKTQEAVNNAILGQNRDFEIAASQQNRADELNALQAAEAILGGQVGRSGEVFNNILSGQQANRDDHWRGLGLALQEKLGIGGLDIDRMRVNQAAGSDAARLAFERQRLGEDSRQFNSSNALGWAQLGLNGQNATIDRILSMLR